MININDIEKQIQETLTQKIEIELQNYDLYSAIEQQIVNTIQEKVNATVTGLLNRYINSETVTQQVNAHMSTNIQDKLDIAVKSRVAQTVSQTDVGTEISNRIAKFVDERMLQASLPDNFIPANAINWNGFTLPAGKISNGIIDNFTSNGIEDCATEISLTVMNGQVVVENELVAQHLSIVGTSKIKELLVDRLTIDGELVIRSGKFADDIRNLVDNRIENYNNKPIDLNGAALTSNKTMLIDNKSLGSGIIESNLRKLGRLVNLTVAGETNLAETLYIDNGRIGINTDEPAGVFTAWDEEAELTVRKFKNRNMFIGSTRDSNITLGVAGNGVLEITRDGVATSAIKVGPITINTADVEPTHRGTPGDLVINSKPLKGQPWAWRCLGAEAWIGLN